MIKKQISGYQCEIEKVEDRWYGRVYVPKWHPVRSKGLDDELVLCGLRGMWVVFISESTFDEVWSKALSISNRLKRMQREHDALLVRVKRSA